MKIYDDLIQSTLSLLPESEARTYPYNPAYSAKEGIKNELILVKEAAFELGEGSLPSVAYTLTTDNAALISGDRILLFGRDLSELKENTPYARITILLTGDIGEHGDQGAHAIIKTLELKKYDVSPRGFMMRASALSCREQVRVSKAAIKNGLSFEHVGNLFISKYKENVHVKAAAVIFVTLPEGPYPELDRLACSAAEITRTLNHILTDYKMDCRACEWKPVCDEVDGLKELHSKTSGQESC